jgi:hypothetical protein
MNAATNVNEVSSPSRAEADQSEARLGLSTNDKLSVRIVKDYASVKGFEEFWEATNWNPNAQMEFFQLINDTRESVIRPHILLLECAGEPQGLIIGRITKEPFRCRIGYKSFCICNVRQLSVVHGGVLGCDSLERAAVVVSELTRMLKHREVDVVLLSFLDTSSPLFELAAQQPNILCRDHLITPQLHWKTRLPSTKAEFLQRVSRKHRYWLNRLDRNLEKDFPGRVICRCYKNVSELDQLLSDLESVARTTYHRRLNVGFRNDEEQRRGRAFEAEKGWLRAYVLYIDGQARAFWAGNVYKDIFYSAATGYDPGYERYELGTVVFLRMIQHLCEEKVAALDYGLGDALYKRRFGDQNWKEASVRIFAFGWPSTPLNIIQTIIKGAIRWLQSFLNRTDLPQRAKKFWRRWGRKRESN